MNAWIAIFVLGTVIEPFKDAEREPYVVELCEVARRNALPEGSSSVTATQTYAACLLTFADMVYPGQPLHACDDVVSRIGPTDPDAVMKVCEKAKSLTENWSRGRF
jgi:hypothetical protein